MSWLQTFSTKTLALPVRRCKYGGEDEYYLEVRETGLHQQEKIKSEVRKETGQETMSMAVVEIQPTDITVDNKHQIPAIGGPIHRKSIPEDDSAEDLPDVDMSRIKAAGVRKQAVSSDAVHATSEATTIRSQHVSNIQAY